MHELVEVFDMQTESKNNGSDEVHAHVLQTVRGCPNIHKTTEVPGVQPCVRAGGRSAALLPINLCWRSAALCSLLCMYPWYSTLPRISLSYYTHVSPSPIIPCYPPPLHYGSLLRPSYQRNIITHIPSCKLGQTFNYRDCVPQ